MRERFHYLDGARGLAAFCVALYHFSSSSSIQLSPFVKNGWLFVDLFFVLSGFVIYHAYFKSDLTVKKFIFIRAARLLPLHFLLLLLFFLMEIAFRIVKGQSIMEIAYPLAVNLLSLQSFNLLDKLWFYGPSWSISSELYASILVFLLFFYVKRFYLLLIIMAIGLMVLFVFKLDIQSSFEYGVVRCVYGIIFGILLYYAYSELKRRNVQVKLSVIYCGLIDFALAIGLYFTFLKAGIHPFAPLVFSVVLLWLCISEKSILRRLCEHRFVLFLGKISFSLYMVHYFIGGRLIRFGAPFLLRKFDIDLVQRVDAKKWNGLILGTDELTGLVFVIIYMSITVFISWYLYKYFEIPTYKYFRKKIDD